MKFVRRPLGGGVCFVFSLFGLERFSLLFVLFL